jgi:hypothetical protein
MYIYRWIDSAVSAAAGVAAAGSELHEVCAAHGIPVEAIIIIIIIIEQGISACDLMDGRSKSFERSPRSACCSRQISCEGNAGGKEHSIAAAYTIYRTVPEERNERDAFQLTATVSAVYITRWPQAFCIFPRSRSFDLFFIFYLLVPLKTSPKGKKKAEIISCCWKESPFLSFIYSSHFLLLSATHRKKGPLVYCVTYGGLSPTDVF